MASYAWSYTASLAPDVTIIRHFYWTIKTAITDVAASIASRKNTIFLTAIQTIRATISLVYTAFDFVVNNDIQDTIDGSSPVNIGQPIQSQG